MNSQCLVAVLIIAISASTGAAAQKKRDSHTATTMINGRRIFARTDKGTTSITRSGSTATISISDHKIKVEKARVTLDKQVKPIPAVAKRVEVDAIGGKVIVTVDHKVLFNAGR